MDKASEGKQSAVSFANPGAFSVKMSRVDSNDGEDLASTVSFAANNKKRRYRPDRVRRKKKKAINSTGSSEDQSPLIS